MRVVVVVDENTKEWFDAEDITVITTDNPVTFESTLRIIKNGQIIAEFTKYTYYRIMETEEGVKKRIKS